MLTGFLIFFVVFFSGLLSSIYLKQKQNPLNVYLYSLPPWFAEGGCIFLALLNGPFKDPGRQIQVAMVVFCLVEILWPCGDKVFHGLCLVECQNLVLLCLLPKALRVLLCYYTQKHVYHLRMHFLKFLRFYAQDTL